MNDGGSDGTVLRTPPKCPQYAPYSTKYGAGTTISSPGSTTARKKLTIAPAAPTVITTSPAAMSVSCCFERYFAIASRTSGIPAFGQYPRPRGLTASSAILQSSSRAFAGGGTSGFPSEKSHTASAPNCFFSSSPFSNILRMKLEFAIDELMSRVTVCIAVSPSAVLFLRRIAELVGEVGKYLLCLLLVFWELLHCLEHKRLGLLHCSVHVCTHELHR